ncbi:MAG: KilA-N domain-containing protein [Lachnospirales bacterium]|jgi:hypothetical protein
MAEKELSELYARLALQFDSVLGTLVSKNLVFPDFVPGIRKDFYDALNEEKRKDFERIFTYTEIISRYIRENADNGPISLTQLAREYSIESPGYVIQSWMCSRNTLEFLRQWEMAENPAFDNAACEELIRQARTSPLTITPSLWVKRTHAIGMTVKQGNGGGVTAHPEIALDFHLWLDPAMRVTMVRLAGQKQG